MHSSLTLYAEALRLYAQYGLSWYCALIVLSAIQVYSDLLYTENFQYGNRFAALQIWNPIL